MSIFRSYDVRGIYGTDINEDVMRRIGAAFAKISSKVAVASDMRLSSNALRRAFIEGFSGKAVDCGTLPLGVGMLHALGKYDYAYITASHLPSEWNGVKFFHKNGIGFMEDENKNLAKIFETRKPITEGKAEGIDEKQLIADYIAYVSSKIKSRKKLHVVLDCGNGMASVAARSLFESLGFSVDTLYDALDGRFPGRGPDPAESPLTELKRKAGGADIGIAYDGDGDRMVLVDDTGRKLTPEQTSYLILLEAVKSPGPIIANVECTRLIDDIAKKFQKKVVRVPVGHTFLMQAALEHKACFGVEVSGHYALPSLAPFDDSLMISAYATAVLSRQERSLSDIVDEVTTYPFERINFDCSDERKFIVVDNLKKKFRSSYERVTTIDGVRVDFPDGWILVRASNTSPCIRLTIEAESANALEKLKKNFSKIVEEEIK